MGGFMPAVTRWYCVKVWSSAKSTGEVESVEDDPDGVLPVWALTEQTESEIAKAIRIRVRIQVPEGV